MDVDEAGYPVVPWPMPSRQSAVIELEAATRKQLPSPDSRLWLHLRIASTSTSTSASVSTSPTQAQSQPEEDNRLERRQSRHLRNRFGPGQLVFLTLFIFYLNFYDLWVGVKQTLSKKAVKSRRILMDHNAITNAQITHCTQTHIQTARNKGF